MSKMNMPGFDAETSLYKSTKGYVVAPNRAAVREGAVIPAQRLMGAPSTVYVPTPTPGVVFLTKKVCWEEKTSTWKLWGVTFQKDCQLCQWFKYAKICPQPPGCFWGWVPDGGPFHECHSSPIAID